MHTTISDVITLSQIPAGKSAVVKGFDGGQHVTSKLISLGIIPGMKVTILSGSKHTPFLVKTGDTRVMIGYGMAKKIMVNGKSS